MIARVGAMRVLDIAAQRCNCIDVAANKTNLEFGLGRYPGS